MTLFVFLLVDSKDLRWKTRVEKLPRILFATYIRNIYLMFAILMLIFSYLIYIYFFLLNENI